MGSVITFVKINWRRESIKALARGCLPWYKSILKSPTRNVWSFVTEMLSIIETNLTRNELGFVEGGLYMIITRFFKRGELITKDSNSEVSS